MEKNSFFPFEITKEIFLHTCTGHKCIHFEIWDVGADVLLGPDAPKENAQDASDKAGTNNVRKLQGHSFS